MNTSKTFFKPKKHDKMNISFSDDGYTIIIGPIINRYYLCWSHYQVFVKDYCNNEDLKKRLQKLTINTCSSESLESVESVESVDLMNQFIINYNESKKIFSIDYVTELLDYRTMLTNEDLMNDLDYMKNEIIGRQILMNKFKQQNNNDAYTKYYQMIYHEPHKLFQFLSHIEYTKYLDIIDNIITKQNDENKTNEVIFDHMYDLINDSNHFWNEHDNETSEHVSEFESGSDSESDSESEFGTGSCSVVTNNEKEENDKNEEKMINKL